MVYLVLYGTMYLEHIGSEKLKDKLKTRKNFLARF